MIVEIRKPRAFCSGLSKNKLDQTTISLTVNSVSTATLSTNPDVDAKNQAVNVLASDIVAELKDFQTKKFSKGSQDIKVNIYDGVGDFYIWQGLVNGPAYTGSADYVSFGINAISKVAKLQQLKTDIYFKIQPAKTFEPAATGSVPMRLRGELELLIKGWKSAIEQNTDLGSIDKEIILAQDSKNQEVLPIWYDILDQSDDNADFIDDKEPQINRSISEYIRAIYQQPTNNFFSTMLQFCNDFKLTYLPPNNSDTEYGRLRGTSNLFASSSPKTVKLVTLYADVGNIFVPAINSVWVAGEGSMYKKTGTQEPGTKLFAAYPAGSATKYTSCTQRVPPPAWLKDLMPIRSGDITKATPRGLDPASQTAFFDAVEMSAKNTASAKLRILNKWAELWFQDLAYANETVTLVTPLDMSWEIGKLYSVTSDSTLFTGLASNIKHTLSIKEANTTVQFSHVKY